MESNVMDSYRERVTLVAVIAPNEPLCQTTQKDLKSYRKLLLVLGLKFFCRINAFTVQQSTLHPDMVVPTQLVSHIHSTHETVVDVDILWARNVMHTAIFGTTLDGGRYRGRGIRRHDIH